MSCYKSMQWDAVTISKNNIVHFSRLYGAISDGRCAESCIFVPDMQYGEWRVFLITGYQCLRFLGGSIICNNELEIEVGLCKIAFNHCTERIRAVVSGNNNRCSHACFSASSMSLI